ncbi:PREDICTED: glutamate receptor 3.7-like isoform X4 [Ipomoea nil]|uniref:glutamate receptor 3.7-like isoform X4 n=1 Tax=Ipomoea nil TaxID=35883 RepID=UPI000901B909|nr:PREDICTED: glutamate receptor 3.7-like isoform X4 [Ipomoea nil]
MKLLLAVGMAILVLGLLTVTVKCERPAVVNVGAVFTFNSVSGRAAKTAMEIAVSDVNGDPSILNGTKLNLIKVDANSSAFLGSIGAFQVIDKKAVAIIGPESSSIVHMISFIATGLEVPLISFSASDPSLSASQFPFFVRMTQSDSVQMAALADLIRHYEWKEVIAIYVDDEYGRNGISSLSDELSQGMSKIHFKFPLSVNFDLGEVTRVLNRSKFLGPQVFVVHMYNDAKLRFFEVAQELNMMTSNYVWFVTDWLSSSLESSSPRSQSSLRVLEGVVGLRPYIPMSVQRTAFISRWKNLQQKKFVLSELTTQALYAYDTVWAVARAIDKLLEEGNNLTFSFNNNFNDMGRTNTNTNTQIDRFKVFEGGEHLLKILTQMNFPGLTGQVHFDESQNLVGSGFEVFNVVEGQIRTVGYWSEFSRLSTSPPPRKPPINNQTTKSEFDQKLGNVRWPGGESTRPRGWLLANKEKPYKIVVPRRTGFTEFVRVNGSNGIEGYCVDVFNEATNLLPYDIHFKFEPYGNGVSNPTYDDLVKMVVDDKYDAAVGDITIVTNRTRSVDFTQPFVDSGLVIVAPVDNSKSSTWVFLRPFTAEMWIVTGLSFLVIAVVIWILEHRVNDDFRGPPKRQLKTMLLFSFSTLFKTNSENTISTLGRMVMLVWLFLLLVLTSSYTASLTSILTVQQLSSSITGMDSLIANNLPIGYQVGSFVYAYLRDNFNIHPSRLVQLRSPEEYESALRLGPGKRGGVAAIVDELPYIELFLANRTDFGIIGQPFAKKGWGFVSPPTISICHDYIYAFMSAQPVTLALTTLLQH